MTKLLFLFFVGLGIISQAQVTRLCDTYNQNKNLENQHLEILQTKKSLEAFTKNYIANPVKDNEIYVIPVVFHVIHNYGPENISKQQIEDGIKWMNNDFQKLSSDTGDIINEFKSIAADCRIEFRLAKIDPDGNCTDGITRTQSYLTYLATEEIKTLVPAWPRHKYLNIWVVYTIGSGAAGYSYYPSSVDGDWGESRDGIVVRYDYVGGIEESSISHGRTLTHEAGHYLNLMHPWGSTNDPELPENCEIDDEVEDTPLTIGHTSCSLYSSSCGSLDNVQNYMEYSYCGKMFTLGQKDRMRACLNSNISDRINLWQESNLIETGVINPLELAICEPIADFITDNQEGCEGLEVQFTDRSFGSDFDSTWSWEWQFPGGNPSNSNEQNPLIIYNATGWFDVSLTVTNSSGSSTKVRERKVHIVSDSSGWWAPFIESFETPSFPLHDVDYNKDWTLISVGPENWERTTLASATGEASIRIDNRGNNEGTQNILISPPINISDLTANVRLFFKLAYAKVDVESGDKLLVYSRSSCEDTWHVELVRTATSLVSNGGNFVSSSFVPENSEWKEFTADMDNYIGQESIRLKFVCESKNGNYLYLDDIQVTDLSSASEINETSFQATILPNPSSGKSLLFVENNKSKELSIAIITPRGEYVFNEIKNTGMNGFEFPLNFDLLPGLYFVRISDGKNSETLKWIIH